MTVERENSAEIDKKIDTILVLDFGGQLAHMITRRFRDVGVYSELVPFDITIEEIANKSPKGLVFSGGPDSIYEKDSPKPDPRILELGFPILGICYGHQLLASMVGGEVKKADKKEFGGQLLDVHGGKLFAGWPKNQNVWFSHGDQVISLPEDFDVVASSKNSQIAAYESREKGIAGIQFHPEAYHTKYGDGLLKNFANFFAAAKAEYSQENLAEILVGKVKEQVGNGNVLMAASGGVDSTVAATIIHQAIGNRLHLVFVDNGLLRKNESDEVKTNLVNFGFRNLTVVDTAGIFLENLAGVSDPEQKRKIISSTFFQVFAQVGQELASDQKIEFLGQGTIFPDRIESAQASAVASRIKTHHNIETPSDFGLKLVEPLEWLYKDEVRNLGKVIGVPDQILLRHPFPGPGLAVRIEGEVTEEKLSIVREADQIFIDELKEANLYDQIWQAFAALRQSEAVSVKGDKRNVGPIITLRAVLSQDAMTADWAEIPQEILRKISTRITNELPVISRVMYDLTQKPPATIEYE